MVVLLAWWDIVFLVRLYLCALPFPASSCPVVARAALVVVETFLISRQPSQMCWDVAFQFPPQILVPGAHLGVFLAGAKSHSKEVCSFMVDVRFILWGLLGYILSCSHGFAFSMIMQHPILR